MATSRRRRGRSPSFWLLAFATLVLLLAAGEVLARWGLGLGSPPLVVAHPRIEYMFLPDQDVQRFGHHIVINHYGMRSDQLAPRSEGELRVLIFGDSILNGGAQTDHADLATSLLQQRLADRLGRPVVVGNVSAGSWGPGNWLAYAQEYGFFEADVVVLVLSSDDSIDSPTFRPLDQRTHPTKAPPSALFEGVSRYLPRFLPQLGVEAPTASRPDRVSERDAGKALADLRAFLLLARDRTPRVLVYQHWTEAELGARRAEPGNAAIREVCESLGVAPVSLEPYLRGSIERGERPYRDGLHPNEVGQRLLAAAFLEHLL